MTLDFADPATPATGIPRDRWGRPLIIPPDGGKPRGYSRPSGIAKFLEDTHALELWKLRRCALGLVADSSIYAQVAAIGDDDTQDKKQRLNKLTDRAMEVAGSIRRRDTGTALHEMCERLDRGEDLRIPDQWAADVAAYRAATAHLEMVAIERFMVCDEIEFAGTPDRIVRIPGNAVHRIFDIKTGSTVTSSGLAFAMQLAIYANSVYYDPATGERTDPGLMDTLGIVAHVPVGEGRCDLYEVDLEAGWEAVQCALTVRDWRKKKLITLLESPASGDAGVAAAAPNVAVVPPVDVPPTSPPKPAPHQPRNGGREDSLDYLRVRVKELIDAGHRDHLLAVWKKEGLPVIAPGTVAELTQNQYDLITTVLSELEVEHDRWVDDIEIASLHTIYAGLADGQQAAFDQWHQRQNWNPAHRLTRDRADTAMKTLEELRTSRGAV